MYETRIIEELEPMNHDAVLTIGKLAAATDVNRETLRYYEQRGLMPPPQRTESGYRLYDGESVGRVRFIKQAQSLGFSLDQIKELLDLRLEQGCNCLQVRQRTEEKLVEIRGKIRRLEAIQTALAKMVTACEEGSLSGGCPILETIEHQAGGTAYVDK